MSRCFAFPPPGYEKKIRTDEADHLIKEKRKEKKHKKDKKDRGKKEGKEKKDKERSKEKHKEKKEKKEKHKDKKDKEKSRTPEEKKTEALPDNRDREKVGINILQNNGNGDSRFVQDLARRIRDGEEATGSRSEQRTKTMVQRNTGQMGRAVENNNHLPFQETRHRRDDNKRLNSQRNLGVSKSSENAFPREYFGVDQKTVEGTGKPMEKKNIGKQMEAKEKTQHMDGLINVEKPRDKEAVRKSEPKDRERHKEKKEEKTEVIIKAGPEKPKITEGIPRPKERDKDSLDTRNNKPPDLSKASNKNTPSDGNLGKRKYLEANGFLYENGSRPNELQRPVASATPAVENGRKLGANRTPPKSSSDSQGTFDIKEHKINGFIDCQEPKVHPLSSLATTAKVRAKEDSEASAKPPHADLNYLTQILSMPEKELPEFDDQEWLLGNLGVKSKKPRTDYSPALDEFQVWDQAFRIESADIAALPYVVPY